MDVQKIDGKKGSGRQAFGIQPIQTRVHLRGVTLGAGERAVVVIRLNSYGLGRNSDVTIKFQMYNHWIHEGE